MTRALLFGFVATLVLGATPRAEAQAIQALGVCHEWDDARYSTADGKVLWEYNTARQHTTVNGVAAKGGSLNGP